MRLTPILGLIGASGLRAVEPPGANRDSVVIPDPIGDLLPCHSERAKRVEKSPEKLLISSKTH